MEFIKKHIFNKFMDKVRGQLLHFSLSVLPYWKVVRYHFIVINNRKHFVMNTQTKWIFLPSENFKYVKNFLLPLFYKNLVVLLCDFDVICVQNFYHSRIAIFLLMNFCNLKYSIFKILFELIQFLIDINFNFLNNSFS